MNPRTSCSSTPVAKPTRPHAAVLYAASNAAGLDRAEIIAATAQLIGRPIDTLKALTNDEADAVLAAFASKEIR